MGKRTVVQVSLVFPAFEHQAEAAVDPDPQMRSCCSRGDRRWSTPRRQSEARRMNGENGVGVEAELIGMPVTRRVGERGTADIVEHR